MTVTLWVLLVAIISFLTNKLLALFTGCNVFQFSAFAFLPFAKALLPSVITGVTALLAGKKNREATRDVNERNIANQWEMWHATNEYNTPLAQRQRLEEAGFNPNLMSGAPTNTATNVNLPDAKPLDYTSISEAGSVATQSFLNAWLTESEVLKKSAETANILEKTKLTEEELLQLQSMRKDIFAIKQEQLRNMQLQNAYKEIANSQLPEKHKVAIREAASRIALANSTMSKQAVERELLEIQRDLWSVGINPNDPTWLRVLATIGIHFLSPLFTNDYFREKLFGRGFFSPIFKP